MLTDWQVQTLLFRHFVTQHPLFYISSTIPIFLDSLINVLHHLKTSNQLPNLVAGTHFLPLSAAPTNLQAIPPASDCSHSIEISIGISLAPASYQTTHSLLNHSSKRSTAI